MSEGTKSLLDIKSTKMNFRKIVAENVFRHIFQLADENIKYSKWWFVVDVRRDPKYTVSCVAYT